MSYCWAMCWTPFLRQRESRRQRSIHAAAFRRSSAISSDNGSRRRKNEQTNRQRFPLFRHFAYIYGEGSVDHGQDGLGYASSWRPFSKKLIYPNVFSRATGQPFLCVSLASNHLEPREFRASSNEEDDGADQKKDGYLIVGEEVWNPETQSTDGSQSAAEYGGTGT